MDHALFVSLKINDRIEIKEVGDVWIRGTIAEQIGENFMVNRDDGLGYTRIDFMSDVRRIA